MTYMRLLALTGKNGQGKSVILDDDDYKKFKNLKWYMSDTGYAMSTNHGEHVRLHRLIMNCPEGLVVDHLNGNKLDCRKSNMRVCTQKENTMNIHGTKGYCYDKSKNKWMVRYKNKFYGRYSTEEEAKRAYKLAKSGVEYVPRRRLNYMLPKNIYRQAGSWGYGFQANGVKHRKFGYATLDEAQDGLKLKLREMRITS